MNADDPRMNLVVDGVARVLYGEGKNGIEIAETWVKAGIHALIAVIDARADNPAAYPTYGEATPEAAARTIIARLLDAGWRPPDAECLEVRPPEAER